MTNAFNKGGQVTDGTSDQEDPDPWADESSIGNVNGIRYPADLIRDMHQRSDVDSATFAQHHTLGLGRNNASQGNHTHNGTDSKAIPALTNALNALSSTITAQPWFFHAGTTTVDAGGGFIVAHFPHGAPWTPAGAIIMPYDGPSVSNTYIFNFETSDATNCTVSVQHNDGGAAGVGEATECFGIAWRVSNHV